MTAFSNLMCAGLGWQGFLVWLRDQEAQAPHSEVQPPMPRLGKASLQNTASVGETGPGSRTIFSQVLLPTACRLQKRKKPA